MGKVVIQKLMLRLLITQSGRVVIPTLCAFKLLRWDEQRVPAVKCLFSCF